MKLLSNAVADSNEEDSFPLKLFLTNTQVPKFYKAFANDSSANMKLSKLNCIKKDNEEDFQVKF